MKAVFCTAYGGPDVLQIREIETPRPKDKEVLIQIHATTVTSGDCRMRSAKTPPGFGLIFRLAFGWNRPKRPIFGTELSGIVASVGRGVTRFREGDRVFAFTGARCGGYAEFICLPETAAIVVLPETLGLEEAAAISFGGTTALHFLRDLAAMRGGEKVLIHGASGGVGTSAIQIAKYFGAEVTGVCSTSNLELVRSLGADQVLDYTQDDPAAKLGYYDIIFDTVGMLPFSRCKAALHDRGKYLNAAAGIPDFLRMLWTSLVGGKRVLGGMAPERREDLVFLKERMEAGELRTVIDRRYPLASIADAHRYVDAGHKKGAVVIQVA